MRLCLIQTPALHEISQIDRGHAIARPKALSESKAALARRMHGQGERAATIASALGVSRATVYRVLADDTD